MKPDRFTSLSSKAASVLRHDTSPPRRYLFAAVYAASISLFVLRSILTRGGIFHMSDLTYLASRKQFSGFHMWDPLTQKQVIINHLVFDPWLAFLDPVPAQRVYLFVLFFMLPFLSFVGFRGLLDRHFDRYVTVSALLASLLYTFNPIVVVRSRHYFLVWFYAFLPLLFYYTVRLSSDVGSDERPERVERPAQSPLQRISSYTRGASDATWAKIAIVLFLMSASVRMPYYFLVPLFAVVAFVSPPYGRHLARQTRAWVKIFGLYFLLTAFWTYPYLMRTLNGSGPTPSGNRYIVTRTVLSLLSRNAELQNVLLLRSFWGNDFLSRIFGIESGLLLTVWGLSVAFVVGLAFLGLLLYLRDKREVLALSALLLLSIFLSKGTNPPFPQFYSWFVLDSPLSGIGWQFRGSIKWNLILMFSYATLAAFAISWLFRTATSALDGADDRLEVGTVVTVGLVLAVVFATAGFPLLSGHIANDVRFETPSSNYEALLDGGADYKVHTYPRSPPTGTPGERGTSRSQFYQYAMTDGADTQRYLAHANVRHVYVTGFASADTTGGLGPDSVVSVSRPREMITAHDSSTYSFTFPYLRERPTVYGSARIDERAEQSLRRSDVVVLNDRPPVPFLSRATVVAPMAHARNNGLSDSWVKAATDDPAHGPWHKRLDRFGIRNWQFGYDRGLVLTTGTRTLESAPPPEELEPLQRWEFDGVEDFEAWNGSTPRRQFGATQELSRNDSELTVRLRDSTSGWKQVRSAPVPVEENGVYHVSARLRGTNTRDVHLKVAELGQDGEVLRIERLETIGDGTFGWEEIGANYVVKNDSTATLRLEVWHGSNTQEPLPNTIRFDTVGITDLTEYAEPVSMEMDVTVDNTTDYRLFARHFESESGGSITVSLDGSSERVSTRGTTDGFTWTDLGTHRLSAGEHEIRLENDRGFNAVNLFVLVPVEQYRDQQRLLDRLLRNRTGVYFYEAERGFEASEEATRPLTRTTIDGRVVLDEGERMRRQIDVDRPGQYTVVARGAGAFDVRLGDERYSFRQPETDTRVLGPITLEAGHYNLSIGNASSASVTVNRTVVAQGFEREGEWSGSPGFTVRRDEVAAHGNSSLAVTTSTADRNWSWVRTGGTDVIPGQRYVVEASLKSENVQSSHALLLGYNTTTETWERLTPIVREHDGTKGWEVYQSALEIPQDVSRVRFALNGGWVRDPSRGNATTWFDDLAVTRIGGNEVDAVWLSSAPNAGSIDRATSAEEGAPVVERVDRISPTKYRVRVEAPEPYLLSFAEGYDPLWVAEVEHPDGARERYGSVPLYATTNGFRINETGAHTVTIRYRPQLWFSQGATVSTVTLLGSVAYLLYGWRRRTGDPWAERVSQHVRALRSSAARVVPWR